MSSLERFKEVVNVATLSLSFVVMICRYDPAHRSRGLSVCRSAGFTDTLTHFEVKVAGVEQHPRVSNLATTALASLCQTKETVDTR